MPVLLVVLPFHIMSEDYLDPLLLQPSDTLYCLLGSSTVGMNAAYLAVDVMPLSDLSLPAKDPPVMASITRKIDPFPLTIALIHMCKYVDVTGKMSWCVDDVNGAVLEDVQHRRQVAECLPLARKVTRGWLTQSRSTGSVDGLVGFGI